MRIVSPGPASQSTGNIAGAPYAAWNNSAGTGLIGPTGTVVPLQSVSFSNANGVSFGVSTLGNGVTLTASFSVPTMSTYVPIWPDSTASLQLAAIGATSNVPVFFPYQLDMPALSFNNVAILESHSVVTTNDSASQSQVVQFGLYSNNASTWSLISSNMSSYAVTMSSVSGTVSFATATGTGGYVYSTSAFTTTAQAQSLFGTVGFRAPQMQFGGPMSLAAGVYAIGILSSGSSSSNAAGIGQALVGDVVLISNLYGMGVSVTTTGLGMGYGTASTVSLPVSMAFSNMTNSAGIIPAVTFQST